jgi:hypothetical protein
MLHTSEIVFNSSLHGRERREQRDISKRDLQSAVRYGKKEVTFSWTGERRWKYTFGDVVYITDVTSSLEVTSWALELPLTCYKLPDILLQKYNEATRRIDANPLMIRSHTVLIVDMSASMNKSDMNGHRTRGYSCHAFL